MKVLVRLIPVQATRELEEKYAVQFLSLWQSNNTENRLQNLTKYIIKYNSFDFSQTHFSLSKSFEEQNLVGVCNFRNCGFYCNLKHLFGEIYCSTRLSWLFTGWCSWFLKLTHVDCSLPLIIFISLHNGTKLIVFTMWTAHFYQVEW